MSLLDVTHLRSSLKTPVALAAGVFLVLFKLIEANSVLTLRQLEHNRRLRKGPLATPNP
jgi:hypothetical protein